MTMITDYRKATRRNELVLGGAVGLVVVLAVVAVTLLITMGGEPEPPPEGAPDARELTADTCAAGLRQPAWVPEGVMRAQVACPEDISRRVGDSTSPDRLGTWIVYDLHGPANEETVPGAAPGSWPQAEVESGAIHPATTITYVAYPGSEKLSSELGGGTVEVAWMDFPEGGGDARVTRVENNGYGPVRVEWTDDGGSYLLLTVLGRTPDGRSGVGVEDLLRMAGSLAG
ncbi:hypothetical protein [Myceligenerans salitolerans]|uniref:DUF4245 domain-containing protein n=1 Tax=Myceligenerans salitolerans TaxID=1230528 RepID=A0ABS3IE12_9MICO|nr:hypothetical protein [Myceligenerans salitolerans]MBO0611277.1 hypothetical protein [Myceligenerans salitolerans]